MSAKDQVELTIDGKAHRGWTSARVEIGIDNLASEFRLDLTERWPGQPERWVIEAGAEAKVSIGGEVLITGFIDQLESNLQKDDHILSIYGRSKAADLIDCSAIATPGSWKNKRLEDIAAELAKPFGLTVTADVSTGAPFKSFAIQPGESVSEVIERMTRMRGLLSISDAQGNVLITKPRPRGVRVRIEQGKHFEIVQGSHNVTERFSQYVLKGQSAGDDNLNGKAASQPKAEANDPGVKRYRPLLIVAEDQATAASLATRAKWEASVRAAKAQSPTVTMPGWRAPGGALWQPMQEIDLVAPAAFVTGQMIVANAAFLIDDGGSSTELRLAYPEAYQPEPVPETAEAGKIKRKGASA